MQINPLRTPILQVEQAKCLRACPRDGSLEIVFRVIVPVLNEIRVVVSDWTIDWVYIPTVLFERAELVEFGSCLLDHVVDGFGAVPHPFRSASDQVRNDIDVFAQAVRFFTVGDGAAVNLADSPAVVARVDVFVGFNFSHGFSLRCVVRIVTRGYLVVRRRLC